MTGIGSGCREVQDQLAAYVDGEQPADARRAVDAHLVACPSCRRDADSERGARDLIRTHRDELRAAAPPDLRARCRSAAAPAPPARMFGRSVRTWVPLSLAATLLLAVTGVVIFGVNDRVQALAAGLVLDHAKCFKIAPASKDEDASAAESRWRAGQGWSITVPHTEPAEGLTLVDVRKCLTPDGWSAHLMYRWNGTPLSVYVVPRAVGSTPVTDTFGHETAIWSADGRTYAVLADGRPPNFDRIVSYIKGHAR
ncbi:MAG TPA: zf-HC2 domain-containing protein [Vicinamibacterales bacterium]